MRDVLRSGLGLVGAALLGLAAGTASALTLDELNAALAEHPEASWTAGDTGVADQFVDARASKTSTFGLDASYKANHGAVDPKVFATPAGMRAALDWRSKDGKNWLTNVRNQGRCGSCVAFAAVGMLEGQYNITGNQAGFNSDFSEEDLFMRIGSCASGSNPFFALMSMKSAGVPDEACAPYTMGRTGQDAPDGSACADVATRALKVGSYTSVSASQAKAALQNGPLMTTMTVYEDFMFYTGGVYRHVTGPAMGGHAITIVGYDDAAGAWIVRNSWGTEWGEGGYFRIAYGDVSGVGNSNYAVTVANDAYVKVSAPGHNQAVAGPIAMQAANPRGAAMGVVRYVLTGKTSDGVREGTFNSDTLVAPLNTADLPDGVYELKATAEVANERPTRPWYELFTIVNHPQQITMNLTPDFDATKPVVDRVYFKLNNQGGAVPLTKAELHIDSTDGAVSKIQNYEDPGTDSMMGWRTKSFPNGTYRVKVVGKIGTLQTFQSQTINVTVQN